MKIARFPMNLACVALSLVVSGSFADDTTPNYPFPQQIDYNGISPNTQSAAKNNEAVGKYYDAWKASFLRKAATGGYYVHGADTDGHGKGTSESHGYGMVITALMAGHDKKAKVEFDGLWKFFNSHRSTLNAELMGWKIDNKEASSKYSSATDGDMDIAYGLLLADKQWGSAGAINYRQEAIDMINKGLKVSDYHPSSHRLMLGDWDIKPFTSRSSDWMPGHLRAYQEATGDAAWDHAINEIYDMVDEINADNSETGLMPDFVTGKVATPDLNNDNLTGEKNSGNYFYNAARTPMRLAMDYIHNGEARSKEASDQLTSWAKTQIGKRYNFNKYYSGYTVDGVVLSGAKYTDTVFIAPVVVAASVDPANQQLVNAGWKFIKNNKDNYFSDTVNLLSMLALTGNWWAPNQVDSVASTVPQAISKLADTNVNEPVDITLQGIDDGTIVSFDVNDNPAHGNVTVVSDVATYTPNLDFAGYDNFQYTVTDDEGAVSLPANVRVLVKEELSSVLACEFGGSVWTTGFSSTVKVTNNTAATISNWVVNIELGEGSTYTHGWAAEYQTNDNILTVGAPSWLTDLAPGASASFGFNGTHLGGYVKPVCF